MEFTDLVTSHLAEHELELNGWKSEFISHQHPSKAEDKIS